MPIISNTFEFDRLVVDHGVCILAVLGSLSLCILGSLVGPHFCEASDLAATPQRRCFTNRIPQRRQRVFHVSYI